MKPTPKQQVQLQLKATELFEGACLTFPSFALSFTLAFSPILAALFTFSNLVFSVFCGKFCKLCVIFVKNMEKVNLSFFLQGERTMSHHFN